MSESVTIVLDHLRDVPTDPNTATTVATSDRGGAPQLTVTIAPATFDTFYSCRHCERYVFVRATGGRVELGITTTLVGKGARGGGRVKNIPRSRWYERDVAPISAQTAKRALPEHCPGCGLANWLHPCGSASNLHPDTHASRLVSAAYDTIRSDPTLRELVARADQTMHAEQARRNRSTR